MPLLTARSLGILAALTNAGMLIFNVGFSKSVPIAALDPNTFSTFGQFMILVWGLAFLFAGISHDASSSLIWLAFSIEKLCYVCNYVNWHMRNDIAAVWHDAHASFSHSDI